MTDKQALHFFELSKLPAITNADDELKLWLALFNADMEEDLARIDALGVDVMSQAISAYRRVAATNEFKELERQRSYAAHNRASALGHARREGIAIGAETEREKWQGVVANKDAALANKDAALADKDLEIAKLRAQLERK